MMLENIFDSSISIKFLRRIWECYCSIEGVFSRAYIFSLIHRLLSGIKDMKARYFKYSVFGRLEGRTRWISVDFIEGSLTLRWLIKSGRKSKDYLFFHFQGAKINELKKGLEDDFSLIPFKTVGTILFVAVLVNIACLLYLQGIGNLHLILRGLLLFAGIAAFNCNVSWKIVRETSIALNIFLKKKVCNIQKNKL